jgi:hypothetical protein
MAVESGTLRSQEGGDSIVFSWSSLEKRLRSAEKRCDVKVWFGLKDKRELGQIKASFQAEEQPLSA